MAAQTQAYPADISSKDALGVLLGDLNLSNIQVPFQLPQFSPSFESVNAFVDLEMKVQAELVREQVNRKVHANAYMPRPARNSVAEEKHMKFNLPRGALQNNELHLSGTSSVLTVPARSRWTNYVVLLQKLSSENPHVMENLSLAFCSQYRKDGVHFRLGSDGSRALSALAPGTVIFGRHLLNYGLIKTHVAAILALRDSATELQDSLVCKELLQGSIDPQDIKQLAQLDRWIQQGDHSVDLSSFNQQQQRALALEALTDKGVVTIQGPPGTGKSHTICNGFIPQLVARNERALVICNSNVAVDALLRKCTSIPALEGKMVRCGFKKFVADDIVEKKLYAEGHTLPSPNRYGNQTGSNSNTADADVQSQIRSKQITFTTIHFASKEKALSSSPDGYWNFDTLVLDEAAQIEDARLFIVLARCPSLKKMLLIGDPKQLQPYVSDSLREQGHGKSTMERLMDSVARVNVSSAPYIMLQQQFRMAPPLRAVVSRLFYDNRLEDTGQVASRGPQPPVALKSLLVINATGTGMVFSKLHQSYENQAEAAIVKKVYDFLFSAAFDGVLPETVEKKDVCVLSPFNRHKDRLRAMICGIDEEHLDAITSDTFSRDSELASPTQSQSVTGTQVTNPDIATQIENIDTVDKFQGSERKVVIISTCVDAKPLRAGNPHFINVACSRTQHLLIVVGNFTVGLDTDPNWSFVQRQAQQDGSYLEHRVELSTAVDGQYDLDEAGLQAKLHSLLEPSAQRLKT